LHPPGAPVRARLRPTGPFIPVSRARRPGTSIGAGLRRLTLRCLPTRIELPAGVLHPMSTREPGEERDDGGTSAGDGCDDRCFIEEDAICYELGGPSRCAPGGCGDGCVYGDDGSECPPPAEVRQEECDDFNTRP